MDSPWPSSIHPPASQADIVAAAEERAASPEPLPDEPLVEPIIQQSYEEVEAAIVAADLEGSPHGAAWHTSFHASEFPGDAEKACGRYQIYAMCNVPQPGGIDPHGRAVMDAGKDIEVQIVTRLYDRGRLISPSPRSPWQMSLRYPKHWLTGAPDSIMLLPHADRGHVIEYKGKDHDKVIDMMRGQMSWDPYHRRQLLTYMGLSHMLHDKLFGKGVRYCKESRRTLVKHPRDTFTGKDGKEHAKLICPVHGYGCEHWDILDIEPVTSGSLIYFSRQRPRTAVEFRFELDLAFMELGFAQLAEWQQHLINGTIPDRPAEWRWTEDPCDWCEMKKHVCKPDLKAGITRIEDSHAIEYAKSISPTYDVLAARDKTLARWGITNEPPEEAEKEQKDG